MPTHTIRLQSLSKLERRFWSMNQLYKKITNLPPEIFKLIAPTLSTEQTEASGAEISIKIVLIKCDAYYYPKNGRNSTESQVNQNEFTFTVNKDSTAKSILENIVKGLLETDPEYYQYLANLFRKIYTSDTDFKTSDKETTALKEITAMITRINNLICQKIGVERLLITTILKEINTIKVEIDDHISSYPKEIRKFTTADKINLNQELLALIAALEKYTPAIQNKPRRKVVIKGKYPKPKAGETSEKTPTPQLREILDSFYNIKNRLNNAMPNTPKKVIPENQSKPFATSPPIGQRKQAFEDGNSGNQMDDKKPSLTVDTKDTLSTVDHDIKNLKEGIAGLSIELSTAKGVANLPPGIFNLCNKLSLSLVSNKEELEELQRRKAKLEANAAAGAPHRPGT